MPAKFSPGAITFTDAAIEVLTRLDARAGASLGQTATALIRRHLQGDWGDDLDAHDLDANDRAVEHGGKIYSFYGEGADRLYVQTEPDRSVTTFLTPEDY